MKLLCDENLPASLAPQLRAAGLDAVDVRERDRAGIDDDQVLALAREEGRVVVTMDVRRFGNLIATPPTSTAGLVVVRMPSLPMRTVVERVVRFFANTPAERIAGALTILEPACTRRRM